MGRAEDLFKRIVERGEAAIDEFIENRQSEELFLDFKRSTDNGGGNRLHDSDRSNLAKAISGFGNSEGGIIVWGVDCRETAGRGDVASLKLPLQDPRRFTSWLEGVVSGCTVPAHSLVRHHTVGIGDGTTGYVVTHIPKSYLAPHQTVRPPQYYIRAGSDFSPAPHGVLSGLFGRHPEPFIFHNWAYSPPTIQSDRSVRVELDFALANQGPGIARELYVNAKVFQPRGGSQARFQILDQTNWTGHFVLDHLLNLISNDSYKVAPGGMTIPLRIELFLRPPFESDLSYEISFGHQNWPTRKLIRTTRMATIADAYLRFTVGQGEPSDATRQGFMEEVLALRSSSGSMTPQEYDLWLGNEGG